MGKKLPRIYVPAHRIERSILLIRGHKVLLDAELAALYEVTIGALNQAVKRNIDRFPDDFMFQLTSDEYEALRSQTVTFKPAGRGTHRKYLPYVFTEQGVAMLSSVLRSPRGSGEHRNHARLRTAAANARVARGSVAATG